MPGTVPLPRAVTVSPHAILGASWPRPGPGRPAWPRRGARPSCALPHRSTPCGAAAGQPCLGRLLTVPPDIHAVPVLAARMRPSRRGGECVVFSPASAAHPQAAGTGGVHDGHGSDSGARRHRRAGRLGRACAAPRRPPVSALARQSRAVRSPATISTSRSASSRAASVPGSRTGPRTAYPAASSAWITAPPWLPAEHEDRACDVHDHRSRLRSFLNGVCWMWPRGSCPGPITVVGGEVQALMAHAALSPPYWDDA